MTPIPLWFYAVAAAVLLVMGGMEGAHLQGNYDDEVASKLAAKQAQAAAAERARTDVVTAQADTKAAAAAADNEQKNETLLQEVPHVVQKDLSRAGFVDAVRVLNNAGASGLPVSETAGPADDTPAAAEAVASTVAENLGQCRADLERFSQLQDWIDGVSAK